jgi:hypothetical protein
VSEQDSSHSGAEGTTPRAITGSNGRFFNVPFALQKKSASRSRDETADHTERILANEYSNSRPQFKQAWYVLFLIVNTPLFRR